jgi:uncharacterized protein YidB (DUF937 family)
VRRLKASTWVANRSSRHINGQEALQRRDRGDSLTDIAKTYGVAHTTIMRLSGAKETISRA